MVRGGSNGVGVGSSTNSIIDYDNAMDDVFFNFRFLA